MEHCKLYINETRVVNKLLLVSIIQPLQNHQKTCEDGGLCAVADVRGVEDQQERGWSLVVPLCCRSPCRIHKVEDAHIVVFLSGKQQSRTRERHPAASGSAYRLGQGVKLKWAVALQWDDSAKVNFLECSKTSVWLTWNLWCSSFFPSSLMYLGHSCQSIHPCGACMLSASYNPGDFPVVWNLMWSCEITSPGNWPLLLDCITSFNKNTLK